VAIGTMGIKTGGSLIALSAANVLSQAGSALAVAQIDSAFTSLNTKRANLGAYMNRLEHAMDNILKYSVNMTDSRSRIKDTDYAATMAELARTNIVRQAGIAMLAQANLQPQGVLQLLQ